MGFGAGHVQDMNNRIKQNRAQRPSKRPKFKEKNRENIYSSEKIVLKPNFKTVSLNKLNRIKRKIRNRSKAEQKKERTINSVLIFIALIFIFGILVCLNL